MHGLIAVAWCVTRFNCHKKIREPLMIKNRKSDSQNKSFMVGGLTPEVGRAFRHSISGIEPPTDTANKSGRDKYAASCKARSVEYVWRNYS